jgi:hypothetical protein
MGRLRPELAPHLRSFPIGNYVIFYRLTQEGIEVARVLHGARDIDALFRANLEKLLGGQSFPHQEMTPCPDQAFSPPRRISDQSSRHLLEAKKGRQGQA